MHSPRKCKDLILSTQLIKPTLCLSLPHRRSTDSLETNPLFIGPETKTIHLSLSSEDERWLKIVITVKKFCFVVKAFNTNTLHVQPESKIH